MKLDRFVRDTLSSMGDEDGQLYVRFLRVTLSVLDEMGLFVMPNFKDIKLAVEGNYSIPMPGDTIDVLTVGKPLENGYLQYLEKKQQLRKGETPCDEVEVITYQNPANTDDFGWWNYEQYGRKDNRFYGKFRFDSEYARVLIESEGRSIEVGDKLLIVYKSSDNNYKTIPKDLVPVVRYRALQMFYETTDVGKASYMSRELKRMIAMFKRNRKDNYSYEDYVNAVTSQFSSAPR